MNDSRTVFFEKYAAAAMEEQKRYGIPASVTLAQMALESYYGQSALARQDNNYFGIKASKSWLDAGSPGVTIMMTSRMKSSALLVLPWKALNTIQRC
jgi:flagellum-specific peptidoglycan hydrolase FlgJ